jgi:hypothetical protein
MAGKNTAAFGIYRDRVSVENAVDALRAADFRNTDISVLFPDNEGTKDFAHDKHTKAPEGTATGATSGAVIGGGLGWLGGNWRPGHTWVGTSHRGWAHSGGTGWRRRGRRNWRPGRSSGWNGHS